MSAPEQAAELLASRWLAVNTHPHREHIAIENLSRQDFETYCPLIQRQVRHARRTRHVMRPLFPGYVFVRINPDLQRWRPILSTFGVRSLVRCGDRLSFIEDGFVAGLRARELDGIIIKPAEPYQLGQQVRMRSGPFDGLVATIIEMDEKDRLVVLMDLLNQSVKVRVAATDICADARDPG
jgi:transcriptional antiterminator RfaH